MLEEERGEGERQPLLSSSSSDRTEYKVYTRRWFMLVVVCLLNISNAMIWITYSPIADETATYYQTSLNGVNWLSLVYLVASIPFGLSATWLLDTLGLRAGIILGAWINCIGAALRVVSSISMVDQKFRFPVLMGGQAVAACSQSFVLFAPTKLAALWFRDDQRAIANMIASMSNPLGILVANVLSPVIQGSSGFLTMHLVFLGPALVAVVMATFGVWSSTPPTPPTASAERESEPFLLGLKQIAKNKQYWVLTVCFGAGLGLFNSLTTLIEQILCPWGYDDNFAGICGALLIGCGIIGAAGFSLFVDKTKKFEEVAKFCFCMAAAACVAFSLTARMYDIPVWIGISIALFGIFGFALYPVCLELAVETTFPVAEATSAGFLLISGQIQGIIFVLVMEVIAVELPVNNLQACKVSKVEPTPPMDYTYPDIFLCCVAAVGAIFLVTCFKCPYKRLRAEQASAAEKILNIASTSRQEQNDSSTQNDLLT
ncbi:solute carrier family 49 member A3 [Lingula anatina]|uniref:Solute carrier family 49 member A3 n=1 Tax=Lingula anatina TaxID=7574 RepID=A0A1S3IUA7_LINAN|nr:solute carrier family 49 member A3 [Lingula anatina]|eukprot:XP_013401658.1 solute carrier family 49 member A3 [Lingula anatina]